jgi:hypothetical protein
MSDEKLDFTRKFIFLGNLALLVWALFAFIGVLFYTPLYSFLYLIVDAIVIYGILRRLGCSSCYKCKACSSGFGRMAGAFFGRGFVKKESVGNRIGLIGFIYFLLLPLPAAVLVLSMLRSFSFLKVFILVCLLAVAAYSLSTWFKRTTVHG